MLTTDFACTLTAKYYNLGNNFSEYLFNSKLFYMLNAKCITIVNTIVFV